MSQFAQLARRLVAETPRTASDQGERQVGHLKRQPSVKSQAATNEPGQAANPKFLFTQIPLKSCKSFEQFFATTNVRLLSYYLNLISSRLFARNGISTRARRKPEPQAYS